MKDTTNVDVTNNNPQHAASGDARAHDSTTAGAVTSGPAANTSTLTANLAINGSAASNTGLAVLDNSHDSGTITNTGRDSDATVSNSQQSDVKVTTITNYKVTNNNSQNATSGNAVERDNNTGGNATSGGVANTSTATITLNVTH
jgi:hypothetical protein